MRGGIATCGCNGVTIGSGSWDTKNAPFTIPQQYRPSYDAVGAALVQNGAVSGGYWISASAGTITIGNYGANGSTGTRYFSVSWGI